MTLFTSVIKKQNVNMAKTGFVYLFVTLFLVLFGAVYEHFSHEVYSYCMLYAFVIPLTCGVLPFFSLAFSQKLPLPRRAACNLYHSGIASLTVGCIFQGVLEIYGTTNSLIRVYWFAGGGLLVCAVVSYIFGCFSSKGHNRLQA